MRKDLKRMMKAMDGTFEITCALSWAVFIFSSVGALCCWAVGEKGTILTAAAVLSGCAAFGSTWAWKISED
ncbi:MAG: hypothetical protein J6Y62_01900 [Clostridia bacterium]|nr:hypothetical protein [Clostridia bacterium]